ncbi:Mu-like prophage major head subunit gpT family protein [Solimonas flava]|uniref:Mu-like prophage major head subunit gpT family protein n=1 Tax=Solimonas flava TaxID=415849 RepID=UPI00042474FC|nr:Mu-like prophage major head subunit gpT family protein [Solimonas flava]
MIINRQNIADLFRGFQTSFQSGFAGVQAQWPLIATVVSSSTSEEHYAWLGKFPMLREWLGDRVIKQMATHDYTVKNRKFESTVGVERDEIEDDKMGVYKTIFEEMGRSAAVHPDTLVWALLAAAFTTPCYDGQYMVDTDHPVGIPGQTAITSVSNHGGGSGTAWFLADLSRPLKPLILQKRREYDFRTINDLNDSEVFKTDRFLCGVDGRLNVGFGFWQMLYGSKQTLDATAFDAARAAMRAFKSDEGQLLGVKPTHVIVPPSLESTAKSIFETQLINGGDSNTHFNAVKVVVADYLQ